MADLANPEQKPAASAEGILRALLVSAPGTGLNWESLARLVVVGQDVSDAAPGVSMPESGFGEIVSAAQVGFFAGVEVIAGPRGCWVVPGNVSTLAALGLAQRVGVTRYDSAALAEATDPWAPSTPVAPAYRIHGGVGALVNFSAGSIPGPSVLVGQLMAHLSHRFGFWLDSGGVVRLMNPVVSQAVTISLVIREPLAA